MKHIKDISFKLYSSIEEMPVYNWFKFNETNDYNWLVVGSEVEKVDIVEQISINKKLVEKYFDKLKKKRWRNLKPKKKDKLKLEKLERQIKSFNDHWLILFQQYLDRYGLDPIHKELLEKKRELLEYKSDLVITGDRNFLNLIYIVEKEIEDLQTGENVEFSDIMATISKFMGYRVDPKEISLVEYKSYIKKLEQQAETNKPKKTVEHG